MNKVIERCRLTSFVLIALSISGCATTYEAVSVDQYLNVDQHGEVNRGGTYEALVKYDGQMAGDALVLGMYGSAHTYKYDYSPYLEQSLTLILNKVYNTVDVNVLDSIQEPIGDGVMSIEIDPAQVRLNCFAVSQTKGECVSTARLNVAVVTPVGKVHHLQIEEELSEEPSMTYSRAQNTIAAAIGAAINSFSAQLYEILISE